MYKVQISRGIYRRILMLLNYTTLHVHFISVTPIACSGCNWRTQYGRRELPHIGVWGAVARCQAVMRRSGGKELPIRSRRVGGATRLGVRAVAGGARLWQVGAA